MATEYVTDEQLAQAYHKSPSQLRRDRVEGQLPRPVKMGHRNRTISAELAIYEEILVLGRDNPKLKAKLKRWLKEEREAGRNAFTRDALDSFLKANKKEVRQ